MERLLGGGAGFALQPRLLSLRSDQVVGVHIPRFIFSATYCQPHLDVNPLAGLWTGSSRKGSRRRWLRSGNWGCTVVAVEGSPLCVPRITGG